MELSSCHIVLNVASIDEARVFYAETLGLPLLESSPNLFAVKAGTMRISVFPGGRNKEATSDAALRMVLRTDDLEEAMSHLSSKGVKIHQDVIEAPGFMRFTMIKDPDSNEIYLAQYLRDPVNTGSANAHT